MPHQKRRRLDVDFHRGSTRPIDKSLINVVQSLGASQVITTMFTATFPCTITGIRWNLNQLQNAGTGEATGRWAIIIARDGITPPSMGQSNGGSLYDPEQDVLSFGSWAIDNNTNHQHEAGETKTMRKLKGGDRLLFIGIGTATNTTAMSGVVQFFCRT